MWLIAFVCILHGGQRGQGVWGMQGRGSSSRGKPLCDIIHPPPHHKHQASFDPFDEECFIMISRNELPLFLPWI